MEEGNPSDSVANEALAAGSDGEIKRSTVIIAELCMLILRISCSPGNREKKPTKNYEEVEVCAHMILYMRSVYPPDLFVRRKKWNVPVFQCKEASIHEYLTEVTKGIAEELDKSNLKRFAIVIHENSALYERFVFGIETQDEGDDAVKSDALRVVNDEDWRPQLSALLRKLSLVDSFLPPLEESNEDGLTFSVVLELRDTREVSSEWSLSSPEISVDVVQSDVIRTVDLGTTRISLSVAKYGKPITPASASQ